MPETQLTDATFENEVLKSAVPVLVDFWAPWCGPCRMMGPVVEELAKEYEGKAKICKLNTDENPVSSSTYKITAIPSIILFKGGKPVGQLVGMQPKSELKKQLDGLL
ncbi:MAG TPA: thioredoxin [Elusimicrobiales bacterium]|nr:thioredoxin [Elusimicrobiales bacterium]